ncbi:CAP domain-containing protein [Corynebacterium lowii]|uniref:Cysteine-rich secretory protein family protein n=1 Tax=Corynebacterium lowii TaxID=1544413 RepID=A0A0N8W081_9CORY|nr:CAP domain-containing protein [Corynebacterium lowii]KQB85962.1 Cysteine-rich secretory protein family protein [Corynebacterium lowii]MDP9850608.1 uncharacterized protein YkwD [Corynebacterium lowii]
MKQRYAVKGLACAIALAAGMSGTAVAVAEEGSAQTVNQASDQSSLATLAKEIFELTNVEREERGIDALKYDSSLGFSAQQWAETMRDNGAAGHADDAGVENVAWFASVPSAEEVLNAWLENLGTRDNLLDPELSKIGIGIAQAEDGSYVVQRFED